MFATMQPRYRAALVLLAIVGLVRPTAYADEKADAEKTRKKIEAALKRPVSFDFNETPLNEVVGFLRDFTEVKIEFDEKALQRVNVAKDHPITLTIKNIKLEEALKKLLSPLKLNYKVTDTQLLITDEKEEGDSPTNPDKPKDDQANAKAAAKSVVDGGAAKPTPSKNPLLTKAVVKPPHKQNDPLQKVVSVDFHETPLEEVVGFLRDHANLNLLLDRKGVESAGAALDRPITLSVKEVTLEQALDLMLEPLQLGYLVLDRVVLITDAHVVNDRPITEVYQVADLVVARDGSQKVHILGNELLQMVQNTVEYKSWMENGGAGTLSFHPLSLCLVVTNRHEVHCKINKLFDALRQAKKEVSQSVNDQQLEAAVAEYAREERERGAKAAADERTQQLAKTTHQDLNARLEAETAMRLARQESEAARADAEKFRAQAEKLGAEAKATATRLAEIEIELGNVRVENRSSQARANAALAEARNQAEAQTKELKEEQEKSLASALARQRALAQEALDAAEQARRQVVELQVRAKENQAKKGAPKPAEKNPKPNADAKVTGNNPTPKK